jgi:FMN phosphatase YigB (HAD superfamily)
VPPEAFFHIGDALDGDVYKAREAGWRALHFPVSRKESARRDQSLCEFNNEMRRLGHDLTRWSKV